MTQLGAARALPPRPIVILGTGGNCVDILDTIDEINAHACEEETPSYDCLGFLDDNREAWGREIHGVRVLGPLAMACDLPPDVRFVNGIGSERNFRRKDAIIATTGLGRDRFETIVHPTASVSRMSVLGAGVVVFQNATITSNVRVGDHVVVLPNAVISHDAAVGDYSILAAGVSLCGGVTVGRCCYLGTNASVRPNVTIGEGAMVGMGSVVLRDVAPTTVVVGSPARFLREAAAVASS